jgi:uncharacterized protein YcbX
VISFCSVWLVIKMHISEINIYPIKSLKGISRESAKIEERGLAFDRRWMLTTPEGMFFTQREFPRMATIAVAMNSGQLTVESDAAGTFTIPFEPDRGEWQKVTVWQSLCDALVYKGMVSEWFSDAIGTKCQLVYMPDASKRHINPRFDRGEDIVSFADGYPLMLIGEESLRDLNLRLKEAHDHEREASYLPDFKPLPMNRFRPNLVISRSDAYAEDDWKSVRIGEAVFRSTKPCERCVITTIDQMTGELTGKEPLKTLATYRMAKDVIPERYSALNVSPNGVLFGQNLVAETPGSGVNVGDSLEITDSY